MAVKPYTTVTIGGSSFLVETIAVNYVNTPFDRVEFDHTRLSQVRLANGVSPLVVQLLGNVPSEVAYNCAVGPGYTPRPLTPNTYPAGWNNVKQRISAVRYTINTGNSPETANIGASVDALLNLAESHFNKNTQFQTRLAIFNGDIDYASLLAAQSDNIETLYFTTGLTLATPDATVSNMLITEFAETMEYAVPQGGGSFEIYKGFTIVLERRAVQAASAA